MRCRGTSSLLILFASLLLAQTERSVWDGVYNEQQDQRGEELYNKECASCHGLSLNGGESAPPLTGGEFMSNWSGLSAGDLFDCIRVSMPADWPGHLSRQQTADILAHIFAVNQFPAGASDLDTRSEVLKQIRIDASKPEGRN